RSRARSWPPLIAIVFANEIGNSLPISAIDRVKEMFCVEADLMLRSPKPEQIQADAQRNGQHADDCFTKRNRHTRCNDTTSGPNRRGSAYLTRKVANCDPASATAGEFGPPRA